MVLLKKTYILASALCVCLCLALPAQAQQTALAADLAAEDDKGFLAALLEDSLGGEGRIVRINGFQGALSRKAKIAQITVADEEGVWLSLTDVLLEWNRSALLRGRLDIEQLSAAEVSLIRPPKAPENDLPTAESSGFALPSLPVAVQINALNIERILLGEAVLGDPAEMTLKASASLEDGSAAVKLEALRIDDHKGKFIVDASYDAQTQNILVDLELSEAKNGLIARALNIEGRPDLQLTVTGEGSIDDLVTFIALETDGAARMKGQVTLKGKTNADRDFSVDLAGNMSALIPKEYRRFFGPKTAIKANGRRSPAGAFELSDLNLKTGALNLQGALALNALSWPTSIALNGEIGIPGNSPIVLPFADGSTSLNGATLQIAYDAKASEKLTAQINLTNLASPTATAQTIQLNVIGAFADNLETAKTVQANIKFDAKGLKFSDPSLQQAVGEHVAGAVKLNYSGGDTLDLNQLNLSGSDYGLTGSLGITGLTNEFQTKISALLQASDLGRFSAITQTQLLGRAELKIQGIANLGGAFNLDIGGETNNLAMGIPQADAVLSGRTTLDLKIVRDANGTRLPQMTVRNDQVRLNGSADLKTNASTAQFDLALANSAVIDPILKGPITLNGTATQDRAGWRVDTKATGPFDAKTSVKGRVTGTEPSVLFDVTLPNIDQIAPQYRGASRLTGRVNKLVGNWQIKTDISGPYGLDATLSGTLTGKNPNLKYALKVPNIASLGAQISGAIALEGTAIQQSQGWRINTSLTGLSGTRAQLSGLVRNNGTLDLATTGTAQLALANPFITPRNIQGQASFDLALNGKPNLSSLSGTFATTGARLSNPNLRIALSNITARANLNRGRVALDVSATVSSGGQITLRGPINDIAGANIADLSIGINSVKLVDPTLYQTILDGTLNVRGSLSGGALISGKINVGETNVQIPSSQSASFAIVPQITHINTSTAARQTLQRARLTSTTETSGSDASGQSYGLNININAPARIYVRGRGLDAELGGSLSLSGRTDRLISSGQFNLLRGRLDVLTKRFELDEGSIVLQGKLDPYMRFAASTTTSVGTASIIMEGHASQPTVRFLSSPEAPEEEVLAQIFFGRDVSQLSAFQALQLASAVATLADKGGEGIVTKLRRGFGLDDLNISTDAQGNTGLKLGKYINDNVYTDVTIGDTNDAGASINIDLTPNLTVRGQVKSDGDSSIGLVFEKDY
mgnify:FL=1